jgi:hypothetical protein
MAPFSSDTLSKRIVFVIRRILLKLNRLAIHDDLALIVP